MMQMLIQFSKAASLAAMMLGTAALAQNVPQNHGRHSPDANGDGTITRAEANAAAEARFARMDANGDGRLTSEDRAAGQERRRGEIFGRIDGDGNGNISRAEWDAHAAQMAAHRSERREQRAERHGAHGQAGGGARTGHMMRRQAHRAGAMAAMAHMADSNNDDAIDRAEFMAAATQRFDRGDTNHDGSVTAAERDAHRAQMRERRGRHRGAGAPPTGG
ncbi:MAG: hypothetical protein ABL882_01890 [Sphingopyxis sp.]